MCSDTLAACTVSQTCNTGTIGGTKTSESGSAFTNPGAIISTSPATSSSPATASSYSFSVTAGTYSVISSVPAGYSVRNSLNGGAYSVGSSALITVGQGGTVNVGWKYNPVTTLAVSGPSSAVACGSSAITVEARDAYGNRAIGYRGTVHLTSSDPAAVPPADHAFTAADNGTFTFQGVVLKSAGSRSLSATDTAVPAISGAMSGITVVPGAAASLAVTAPAGATAGSAFTATVEARDACNGNRVTGYSGTVGFTSSDSSSTVPGPYRFTAQDMGFKTFPGGFTLLTAGSQTISASDGSIGGVSASIPVQPRPAASLAVAGLPTHVTAGDSVPVRITAFDPYGNVATGYVGTVHFASSDPQAALPPDHTFLPADLGMQTICCVSLRSAGSQTVTVSDAGSAISGVSPAVAVGPAAASALRISGLGSASAGVALSPSVAAVGPFGNLDPSYRGTIRFASSDPQATVPANYAFVASDAGAHTFLNALVLKSAGVQTVVATDTANPLVTGNSPAIVSPGPAVSLILTTPGTAAAGSAFNASVEARDAFANRATGYTGSVSFSCTDAQASLPGTYSFVPADAGLKAALPITLNTAGSQNVSVSDGVLGATSPTIQVAPGPAQRFLVSGFPSSVSSGIAGSVTVEARDASGNRATGYQGTARFTSSDPNATLPAPIAFVAGDLGLKILSGVVLRTTGTQSITVTDGAITGTQQGITVTSPDVPVWPAGSTLVASAASNTSAVLTWSAAADALLGVSGYRVYKDGALVQTVGGSTLSTTIGGLTLGVQSSFQVQAGNSAGNWSVDGPATTYVAVPPDLTLIAPPVERSTPTTLFTSTSFIYSGPNAVQIGVAAGTIAEKRAAALRGTVHSRSGDPIPGVRVTVKDHPEYGWTLSRGDGSYDLVINGGGQITLALERDGFLPLQRQLSPGWAEYGVAGDAVMIPYDPVASLIDLSQTSVAQAAQGSVSQDANGPRHATVIFPPGTSVTLTLPDGSTRSLSTMHVRLSEYTVGPQGPVAMPLELPKTSAYTYAAAFTLDEAVALNADKVAFSQTVYGYVENFLGFPVGTPVPSGYHDHDKAAWVPEDDGKVVRILDVSTGTATIDVDGSGLPASSAQLAALGFSASELDRLATIYPTGQAVWRVPLKHFSCYDWNYLPGPPADADPPRSPPTTATSASCTHERDGSIIECENQTLGQRLPLTGVPFTLNYRSDRVRGRRAAYQIGANIGPGGCRAEPTLTDYVDPLCGRASVWVRSWAAISTAGQAPQIFEGFGNGGLVNYEWDGKDRFGRELQGSQEATVKLCNTFPGAWYELPGSGVTRSFGYTRSSAPFTLPGPRDGLTYDVCLSYKLRVGTVDVQPEGLGGWTLSAHHRYDYAGETIYLGSGEKLIAPAIDALVVNPVAGGLTSGVGGPPCASGGSYTTQGTLDGRPAYPSCSGGILPSVQAPNGCCGGCGCRQ